MEAHILMVAGTSCTRGDHWIDAQLAVSTARVSMADSELNRCRAQEAA